MGLPHFSARSPLDQQALAPYSLPDRVLRSTAGQLLDRAVQAPYRCARGLAQATTDTKHRQARRRTVTVLVSSVSADQSSHTRLPCVPDAARDEHGLPFDYLHKLIRIGSSSSSNSNETSFGNRMVSVPTALVSAFYTCWWWVRPSLALSAECKGRLALRNHMQWTFVEEPSERHKERFYV
jgi:hypothetical protein